MSNSQPVNPAIARPLRTATQLATSTAVIEFIDAVIYDMNDRAYFASVGLLVIVLSSVQVLVEDYFGKAFLRRIPEPDTPVVDA